MRKATILCLSNSNLGSYYQESAVMVSYSIYINLSKTCTYSMEQSPP